MAFLKIGRNKLSYDDIHDEYRQTQINDDDDDHDDDDFEFTWTMVLKTDILTKIQ